jgi:hypothetical protein
MMMNTIILKRLATISAAVSFARKIDETHIKRYHIGLPKLLIPPTYKFTLDPIVEVRKYLEKEFNEPVELIIEPPIAGPSSGSALDFETLPIDNLPISNRLKRIMRNDVTGRTVMQVPTGANLFSKLLIKVFGYKTPKFFYYLGYRAIRELYRSEYINITYLEKDEASAIKELCRCLTAAESVLKPVKAFLYTPVIIVLADTLGLDQRTKMITVAPLFGVFRDDKCLSADDKKLLDELHFTDEGNRGGWLYGKDPESDMTFEDVYLNLEYMPVGGAVEGAK